MKILIVDDEELITDALKLFLGKRIHEVIVANSAQEAISEIGNIQGQLDILITDICMPKTDGLTLMNVVKRKYPDIHIILMTGNLRDYSASTALERGACAYLRKPIKLSELNLLLEQIKKYRESSGLLESLTKEIKSGQKKYEEVVKDYQFARRMHSKLYPKDFSWLNRTHIHVRYLPLAAIGGDFVDIRPYGKKKTLLMLADISGHGASAAFGAITLKTWVSSLRYGLAPDKILREAGAILTEMFPDEIYATAFCGIYNEEKYELHYSIAGHPAPFILNPAHKETFLKGNGGALGIKLNSNRETLKKVLSPGDTLIIYTDGLIRQSSELLEKIHVISRDLEDAFPWKNPEKLITLIIDTCNELDPSHAFTDDLAVIALSPKNPEELSQLPSLKGKKALIFCNDEQMKRDFLRMLFLNECEIESKENKVGALSDINEKNPDIIICNINAKRDEDLEMISKIRQGFPGIPLMVAACGTSEKIAKLCIRENVSGFLNTPFEDSDLVLSIQNALAFKPEKDQIKFDDVMPDWMDFVISSSPAALKLLNKYLELLQNQPIPPDVMKDVLYCIREIAGNAIEWGNLRNPDFKVRISTIVLSNKIMIKISDEGAGFDVKGVLGEKENVFSIIDTRKQEGKRDGGFGLPIVKELMDKIAYNEQGNTVIMTKYFYRKY